MILIYTKYKVYFIKMIDGFVEFITLLLNISQKPYNNVIK